MEVIIEPSWKAQLHSEFVQPYFTQLVQFVKQEYLTQTVYPPGKLIFNAFDQTPFDKVKVVILGQDPYHGPGQAHGLCFSVNKGIALPPSLRNIYKELQSDMGISVLHSGDLTRWAQQGVFLLNATLTVRANEAGSHQKKGWENFTDAAIKLLAQKREHLVFILWGAYAQRKAEIIDPQKHLVLQSVHPSPLSASRGFFGNHHFTQTNNYLIKHGLDPIQW